jgi:hypothetical protein
MHSLFVLIPYHCLVKDGTRTDATYTYTQLFVNTCLTTAVRLLVPRDSG